MGFSFAGPASLMTSQQLRRNDWPDTEALFRLLGIDFAAEGDKAPPFAPVFKSLGLQFDLKDVDKGFFSLGHTTSRRQELLEQIGAMLSDGNALVNPKEFELLHGRLVWFNSFVFGRTLKAAVSVVSKYSRANTSKVTVEGALKDALVVPQEELAKDEPVVVNGSTTETWTIYTDGAFESDGSIKASVGAVLVDQAGLVVECFGLEIQDGLREEFLQDSKHPIFRSSWHSVSGNNNW